MALVAAHDWSKDMDNRQQRPHSNTDPANATGAVTQQSQSPNAYAQPPYSYAHPQQPSPPWHMAGMNQMNVAHGQPGPGYFPPMQFYPQHYPHPQQQPPPPPQMHAQHPHAQGSPYGQPPQMFDPNAQFAQWAYQQMMFNAQQSHQLSMSPQPQSPPQQQQHGRSGSHSGSHSGSNAGTPTTEYYQTPFGPNRFQQQASPPASQQSSNNGSYQGFHPYRRPERGERRQHSENSASASASNGNSVPFQPPYARSDATGSSTSVNSSSSTSHRSRTNSGTSASGSARPQLGQQSNPKHTPRQSSTSSTTSAARSGSSSSSTVSSSTLSTPGSTPTAPRTSRPSPLSQGTILSAAERRKSRDDSDLAAMLNSTSLGDPSPATPAARSGLKGRLRRALSFNAAQTLREEEEEAAKINGKKKEKADNLDTEGEGDGASMATKKTKKSLRMFNSRFNASTDNISLSSTVSSASVMIRKLGSMGKLARRNSLAGITSLFKDKDKDKNKDDDDEVTDPKGKKSKGKSRKAEASVSHATVEVDRSSDWSGPGMEGLSPAAKLARQHTLKSNAEAAARAKAQQEAQAAAAAAAAAAAGTASGTNGEVLPTTWERNTATKHGVNLGTVREDGMRVVVEEDSDEEEGEMRRQSDDLGSGSDEDSTWHGHGQEEDEDVTVRMGGAGVAQDDEGSNLGHADEDDELDEPWAMNCRRSIERTRQPMRGILKNTQGYQQDEQAIGPNAAFMQRNRANSYDSVPSHQTERGPLAHMPPSDPDHIDGLHRHNSHRSTTSTVKESATNGPPFLPPLHFDSSQTLAPSLSTSSSSSAADGANNRNSVFNHANNSEPTLSTMVAAPPTLSHRSATTPAKRLAFAANLSIYDTFSSATYDRRSEPATWSRLTPALAQRIKEELNSYKMEEMEVHASSRIHTQFFV